MTENTEEFMTEAFNAAVDAGKEGLATTLIICGAAVDNRIPDPLTALAVRSISKRLGLRSEEGATLVAQRIVRANAPVNALKLA